MLALGAQPFDQTAQFLAAAAIGHQHRVVLDDHHQILDADQRREPAFAQHIAAAGVKENDFAVGGIAVGVLRQECPDRVQPPTSDQP